MYFHIWFLSWPCVVALSAGLINCPEYVAEQGRWVPLGESPLVILVEDVRWLIQPPAHSLNPDSSSTVPLSQAVGRARRLRLGS